MKNIFYSLGFLLLANSLQAQQIPFVHQYNQNPFIYNPAAAGYEAKTTLNALYYRQFDKMPYAPTTQVITADGRIANTNHGLGISTVIDKTNLISNLQATIAYSYAMMFDTNKNHRLSLGLSTALTSQRFNFADAKSYTQGDPTLLPSNTRSSSIDATFGLAYQYKNLKIQGSVSNLFQNKIYYQSSQHLTNDIYNTPARHVVGGARYEFLFGKKKEHSLTPLYNVMWVPNSLLQNEGGVLYAYQKTLQLGGGVRHSYQAFVPHYLWAHLGVQLRQQVQFQYYFQTNFGNKKAFNYLGNSHEIGLQYSLAPMAKKKRQ